VRLLALLLAALLAACFPPPASAKCPRLPVKIYRGDASFAADEQFAIKRAGYAWGDFSSGHVTMVDRDRVRARGRVAVAAVRSRERGLLPIGGPRGDDARAIRCAVGIQPRGPQALSGAAPFVGAAILNILMPEAAHAPLPLSVTLRDA